MPRVLIVGSGASAVHFALTALEKGCEVTMLDVGHRRPPAVHPEATFQDLKTALDDPVRYFLGANGEGVVYPATKASYYGFPPSKTYVFATPPTWAARASNIQPLFTFAQGGFAETWTAGVYPFNDADLRDFPVGYAELAPHYRTVTRRIGIAAQEDDLARFLPFDAAADYLPPLPLDPHSTYLVDRYQHHRASLNRDLRFYLGRSRLATLSHDHGGRRACTNLGRCLWGCPTGSIYSPASTLAECLREPRFRYCAGLLVRYFDYDTTGRIRSVAAEDIAGGGIHEFTADAYVLAAGALGSSKIYLDSIHRRTGRVVELTGLMDNRQVHIPFLSLAMIGQPVDTASYQFHHLAFGIEQPDPREYVHGQITTLKAASVHPIVQSLPLDFRAGLAVFRSLRTGLGIANVNLCDHRRPESCLTIRPRAESGNSDLVLHYADDPDEGRLIRECVGQVKRALARLGCMVPPGMTRVLPKGASVHYAGTIPMSRDERPHSCTPAGQSREFPNLYLADGASFPFLPAKNLTFTLMANAARIAEGVS